MRNAAAKIKTDFEEAIRILNEENKACQSSFENFAKNLGEKILCLAALSEGKELERYDFGGTVLNRQVPGIVRMAQLPSPIRSRYSRHLANSPSVTTRNIRLTDF